MDLNIFDMTPTEHMYTYTQFIQIQAQTGCIGHLRGDMDTDGKGFYTSWDDHRAFLKTDEFKAEFDEVINALRFDAQYEGILTNRSSLTKYCCAHQNCLPVKGWMIIDRVAVLQELLNAFCRFASLLIGIQRKVYVML